MQNHKVVLVRGAVYFNHLSLFFSSMVLSRSNFVKQKYYRNSTNDVDNFSILFPDLEHFIKVQDDGGSGYILADEDHPTQKKTVPVVFHWEYGGDEVFLSGSFNDWKTKVPMTKR